MSRHIYQHPESFVFENGKELVNAHQLLAGHLGIDLLPNIFQMPVIKRSIQPTVMTAF